MKKSLRNNQEVAHVWAAQSQSEGYASHFFFEGPRIFSYGRHFEVARIVRPGVVLFTSRRYSMSTGRHQSYARSAVSHMRVYQVPSMEDHNENTEYLIKELTAQLSSISRMRKSQEFWLEQYAAGAESAAAYVLEFGKDIRKPLQRAIADVYKTRNSPLTPAQLAKFKAQAAAQREKAKTERALQAVQLEQRRRIAQKDYDAWKAGLDVRLDWEMQKLFPVALRVVENEIQTTRGAAIPVIEAKKLWHAMEAKQEIIGMRLGHYTVSGINDNELTVGCHVIPLKEVYRMARRLDLIAA